MVFTFFLLVTFAVSVFRKNTESPDSTRALIDNTDLEIYSRLNDLYAISKSLENFRQHNKRYPISRENGTQWSSILTAGDSWIKGISPTYIERLPVDDRKSTLDAEQYRYRSDGANYTILSLNPPDCKTVADKYPQIAIIENNHCIAYGFRSKNGIWIWW